MKEKYQIFMQQAHAYPGDVIYGTAVVALPKSKAKKLWKVSVRFRGVEFCYFKDSMFISQNELRAAHEENEIIKADLETIFWERPEKDYATGAPAFTESEQEWNFALPIPVGIPASFSSSQGHIRYTLVLKLDFMPDKAMRSEKEIKIYSSVASLQAIAPKICSTDRSKPLEAMCCWNGGDMYGLIEVEDEKVTKGSPLVFYAGESINVHIIIKNQTNVFFTMSKIKLIKITHLQCVPANQRVKEEERKATKVLAINIPSQIWFEPSHGKVFPGGTIDHKTKLTIPSHNQSISGTLCSVEYAIRLVVEPKRGKTLLVELPLFVAVPEAEITQANQVVANDASLNLRSKANRFNLATSVEWRDLKEKVKR